jgi:hypothetical protein
MAQSSHRESAKIYQFPTRDRAGRATRIADLAPADVANADFGSAWYHDAAVQEAEQARKRQPR